MNILISNNINGIFLWNSPNQDEINRALLDIKKEDFAFFTGVYDRVSAAYPERFMVSNAYDFQSIADAFDLAGKEGCARLVERDLRTTSIEEYLIEQLQGLPASRLIVTSVITHKGTCDVYFKKISDELLVSSKLANCLKPVATLPETPRKSSLLEMPLLAGYFEIVGELSLKELEAKLSAISDEKEQMVFLSAWLDTQTGQPFHRSTSFTVKKVAIRLKAAFNEVEAFVQGKRNIAHTLDFSTLSPDAQYFREQEQLYHAYRKADNEFMYPE